MCADSSRSWEGWVLRASAERADAEDPAEPEDEYENISPEESVEELVSFLIGLKVAGILSATQACTVCFFGPPRPG